MLPSGWRINIEETVAGEIRMLIESPSSGGAVFTVPACSARGEILRKLAAEIRKEDGTTETETPARS
jgi:hypothetical protein